MKIQVTQTLPNGQVTQQVLSKDGAEVLKIQAQPGAKLSFNVEGSKPVEGMATKPKTGDIKKVGNNLVLESEGEQLVEVTDFYSTAGASVGDVGWNYAATDAGVMAATPEAQALSSDAAVSESGALLPAIAPGWLVAGGAAAVAAVASGGGSTAAAVVAANVVSGVITAGPLVAGHGLAVVLYKADGVTLVNGTLVASTATMNVGGVSGKFSLDVGSYTGVIVAKVVDSSAGADFNNEANNLATDLTAVLFAVGVMSGGALTLNINPLTTIAGQLAGVASDGSAATGLTTTTVNNANSSTANAFGLTDVTTTAPDTTNDGTTSTNAIGAVLAALSGMDSTGSQQSTIDTLKAAITQTTTTTATLSAPQQAALISAAALVESSTGATGLVNTLSDALTAKDNTSASFTINDIDAGLTTVNDIIDPAEIAGAITIGGTMATGTTAVSLVINSGAPVAATLVDATHWTYVISAGSAAAAFGADGTKSVVATATVGATTATATRLFVVNATDDAPIAVLLGGVTSTLAENTSTTAHIKVADIAVLDDGTGTNTLGLTGSDAAHFEIVGNALYVKANEVLNYEVQNSYSVAVTATGGATPGTVSSNYTLNLTNVNEAPTAAGTAPTATAVVNVPYTLNMATYFADVDAGGLTGGTYSATGLGNGLSINSSTGVISGTALANAAAASVVVTFTDAGGLSVAQTFNLQAVTAPVVQSFTVVDAVGTTTLGTGGDALTFAVTLSEAVTVSGTVTAHFSVNGTDVTATYTGVGGSATLNFTGTSPVTGDGHAITLTSISGGTVTGNVSSQLLQAPTAAALSYANYTVDNTAPSVTASYNVNENTAADTALHTITLAGSDANGPVTFSGLTGADAAKFTLSGNTLTFAGQTNYEVADDTGANHVYDVSVVGTDAVGKTTTQAITITVQDVNEAPTVATPIADQTFVVGGAVDSFVVPVGAFADVDAGTTLTYTATLADGSALPTWLTFTPGTRTFSGNPTANGTVTVRVTASDGTLSVFDDFIITSVTAPVVQSFTVVDATSSNTTTKGTSGEALTFAVTFSEAITVTGTLTAHFSVNGVDVTATYTGAGGSTLNFTGGTVPSTGDGAVISLTSLTGTTLGNVSGQPMVAPTAAAVTYSLYTVDNTAPTVTAAYTTTENTASDTALHTITLAGTDTNGPVTFSGLTGADAAKFTLSGNTLTFAGQANYEVADDAGANHVYDVSVVGTDAVGKATTQAITITVNDVNEAPVLAIPLVDQAAVLTQAFNYVVPTGAFTDVDAGTTITYSATLTSGAALSTAAGWTNLAFNTSTHTFTGTATDATTGDIDVRVTASDGTLSVYDDFHINAVSAPALSTTLGGVLNFDVRSNIVLSVGETVTKNSLGHIIITDLGGTGFSGEATTHTIDLNMAVAADAARVTIVGTGTNTKVIINPEFDLDLSSNYSLAIDTGVFHGATSGQDSVAFTTVNFSTVTPGTSTTTAAAGAVQSQGYFTDAFLDAAYLPASATSNAPTYALSNTMKWVDMAGVGNVGAAIALQVDASTGDYAFVWKDMDNRSTGNGEIVLADTQIQINKFGANDLVYIDNQEHQATAQADIVANGVTGGVGSAADPSWFAFGGVSLGANIYVAVDPIHTLPTYTDGQLANLTSNGWSNTGMVISA
jgi:large repetitive protein